MAGLPAAFNPIQVRINQLAKAADGAAAASEGVSDSVDMLGIGIGKGLGAHGGLLADTIREANYKLQAVVEKGLREIAVQIGEIGKRPNGERDSSSDEILEALTFAVRPNGSYQRRHWFGLLAAAAGFESLADIAKIRGDQDQAIAEVMRRFAEAAAADPSLRRLTERDVAVVVRAARLMGAPS